jgi:sialate O-acetylesterase
VAACILKAQVSVSSIFCNNMVLQRNIEVPIWGTSLTDNEKVIVTFAGQNVSTNSIHGKWMAKLKPLKANTQPETLTIIGSNNKITITNVLVGEVWLCGGQSNMERQLGLRSGQKPLLNWEQEASMASFPQIREFALPHVNDVTVPITSLKAKWIVCDTQTVKQFSAIGYFFGKALHEKLKVPIGLIHSSWGGTPAEKWISRQALKSNSELKKIVENYDKAIADYPAKLQAYKKDEQIILQQWVADTLQAKQLGKPLPKKPVAPINPQKSGDCGGLFTTMIEPLIPYAMKGVIWYQGEANVGNPKQYKALFPALIADWRAQWSEGDFPFLFVQLAPYKSNTPELREAQLYTWQTVPNTAMVVTIDCGDTTDIHPTNKKPVGERLALAARALAYEEKKLEYSGPIYQSMKINKNKIELSFTHVGKGLWAKDGDLYGFTISEDGQKFVPATAIIEKDKIVVFANRINAPIAVRYAFINNARGNLYNIDGLPASPFRTEIN